LLKKYQKNRKTARLGLEPVIYRSQIQAFYHWSYPDPVGTLVHCEYGFDPALKAKTSLTMRWRVDTEPLMDLHANPAASL